MAAMRSPIATLALASVLAAALPPSTSRAQGPFATADEPRDQVALHAELDPQRHRIRGTLRWRFTNRSSRPVSELWWHLYLNAFRSEERGGSVFVREGGTQIRHRRVGVEGSIELSSLTLADGRDLLARSTSDVGVDADRTQLRTTLFAPLPPGASVELHATFVTQLPEAVARSGFVGDFHVAAQWFPKLARLEPDGRWAHFPYHGLGEFYADFADYSVDVLVPAGVMVVANGSPDPDTPPAGAPEGALRRFRYRAAAVHDVVFVASPSIHLLEQRQPLGARSVRVRVAYPPGYEGAAREHMLVTRDGLSYFSRVFFDYPYDTLTVVLPPAGAGALAGMEYPTLFLSAGPWWASSRPLLGARAAETSAHELAHQWFQGLVATNEVRYPALDEGLTSWATGELMRHREGRGSGLRFAGLTIDGFELDRAWGLARVTPRSPLSAAYEFDTEGYFRTVYVYVPLALESIARAWGRERLLRALGAYSRAQRFRHPGPAALRAAFRDEYGEWFARDVFDAVFTRGCTLHTELSELTTECDEAGCRDEIVARRRGCLPLPLEVEVTTTDGVTRYPFPASQRALRIEVDPQRLLSARVDPSHRNLTDPRRLDDLRRYPGAARHRPRPTNESGLSVRLLALFQLLFSAVGP